MTKRCLFKIKSNDENEPDYKRSNSISISSYTSLRAWIMMNYEYVNGFLTSTNAVFEHACEVKDSLITAEESMTKCILGRAIMEMWKGQVVNGQRVMGEDNNNRTGVYINLKRIDIGDITNGNDEDEKLEDVVSMLKEGNGKDDWQVQVINSTCITCTHIEGITFNDVRVITEICVSMPVEQNIAISIKYHDREIPLAKTGIVPVLSNLKGTVAKVRFLMSFLNASHRCCGFYVDEDSRANSSLKIYDVKDSSGQKETRAFSPNCEVFTNSCDLQRCLNCKNAKKTYALYMKRKGEAKDTGSGFNHCYMTREMLIEKIETEKKAKLREKRHKEQAEEKVIQMDDDDHNDLQELLNRVDKDDIPHKMMDMWDQQKRIIESPSKNGYRWHPQIIKLCIELYAKNPHVLDPLRDVLYLPSNRTIRYHKNKVDEKPGWNREVMEWCLEEAQANDFKDQDYWGGFVLDEMKIQEDLEMIIKNGKHKLVGFVDLGEVHDDMEVLSGKNDDNVPKLASHVLQFIFIGDSGLRFPLAQFPSQACTASDLALIFWEGVEMMKETGFT